MTGFISRIITRHSYPQNNIAPRLPGKFESTAGVTQNLFANNFGPSDGSADNPEDIGNNGFDHTQHNASESIVPASVNDGEVPPDKSKPNTVKLSNANFQTPFIAKQNAEINKYERSVLPDETNSTYQNTNPKASTTNNEQNSNGAVDYKLPGNYNNNEQNATDNEAISSGSFKFFASAFSEKEEKIKEATSFQIQQPLFTIPSTLQPYGFASLTSNKNNNQPAIKVHIGKIEIRAVNQPSSNEVRTKNSDANKPAMSLDDYLKKRNAR